MQVPSTPWANTLRITSMIFIHDRADSKLSQVAAYVIGVLDTCGRPGGYSSTRSIARHRDHAARQAVISGVP